MWLVLTFKLFISALIDLRCMTHLAKITEDQNYARPEFSPGSLGLASPFSNPSENEIIYFQDTTKARTYKKGKILYLQDEPAENFYVIYGGWIKLFHTLPEGEEIVVDMLTTGHVLGENAMFQQDRHVCSAQVVEDALLLSIPSGIFKEQIRLNPDLALNILSSISRQHRRHHGDMVFNFMLNAAQRIGYFLLKFCPRDKKKDIFFHLPYEKTLIAQTLGMNIATFSRALNILRQKTNIHIDGSYVEINSIMQLTKFVYGPRRAVQA